MCTNGLLNNTDGVFAPYSLEVAAHWSYRVITPSWLAARSRTRHRCYGCTREPMPYEPTIGSLPGFRGHGAVGGHTVSQGCV